MDFTWSSEQRELFTAIERFAAAELNEGIAERDERGEFSRDGWLKCGEFGIPGLPLEEKYGGSGMDALTTVGALERLGYACRDNGLVFSINAHMWTVLMPIAAFGTEEQKQRYLPGLANGTLIGGNGTSEPDSGSDAYSMRSTAVKRGDRYVLNGSKIFVTNGPVADVLVVYANTNPDKGPLGISGFIVDGNSPGMTVTRKIDKMGIRTSPMAEIYFDNCEVPETNRLGKEGAGPGAVHAFDGLGARLHPGQRGGLDAAIVGNVHPLRQAAQGVRPADRQVPAGGHEAGRHEAADRDGAADALLSCLADRLGPQCRDGSGDEQALHQRKLGALLRGRDPDSRRLRLHDRV